MAESPPGTASPGRASELVPTVEAELSQKSGSSWVAIIETELLFSLPSSSSYQICISPLYALIKNQMRGREEEETNNASYTFGLQKRKAHSNAFEDNKEEMIHA